MKHICITLVILVMTLANLRAGVFDQTTVGVRAAGLGNAFSSLADDASAIYWNPAGLTKIKGRELAAYYTEPYTLGLIQNTFLAYAQSGIGEGSIGIAYKELGTTSNVDFLDYEEGAMYISYGRLFFDKLSLGVTFKYYFVEMSTSARTLNKITGSDFGVDAGLMYQVNKYLDLAAVIQDLNTPKIFFDSQAEEELPFKLRYGLNAKPLKDWNIVLEGEYQQHEGTDFRFGTEYWLFDGHFGVRAGAGKPDSNDWVQTAGFSVMYNKVFIEYALANHIDLGLTHHAGLRARF